MRQDQELLSFDCLPEQVVGLSPLACLVDAPVVMQPEGLLVQTEGWKESPQDSRDVPQVAPEVSRYSIGGPILLQIFERFQQSSHPQGSHEELKDWMF